MNALKQLFEQIRTLDPNDPGRWPFIVRVSAIVVLFVLASSLGYYFFVWKTQRPLLLEARAKETTLWEDLENKARKAANLQAYKDQLAEMEKSFGAMLRQLPNKTEVPNLLVDISQTGLAAGLEEKLFQPASENRKDFYAELPIRIRLTGDYHEMGNFASGIAALPRIVTLDEMKIKSEDKNVYDNLSFELTAKTYRYLDDNEIASAEKAKAPMGPGAPAT